MRSRCTWTLRPSSGLLRRAGSFGDMAVLGFYPNKQMTTGEGGAVLDRDSVHATRLCSLRNQGRSASGEWLDLVETGYNYRLSELACALGRVQLSRLDKMLMLRRAAALGEAIQAQA